MKNIFLIVDDEEMLRESLSGILKILFPNNEVIMAPNGAKAVELFRENQGKIALIITDKDMPTMSGLALIELIKKTDATVPIILATGNSKVPENHGADWLMPKPFPPPEELAEIIRRVLTAQPPAPL